jgi:VWFA-related protein
VDTPSPFSAPLLAIIIVLWLSVFPIAGAQTFKAQVERVLVDVIVQGELSGTLKQEDFILLADGKPKDISYFGKDELPLAIAMLIDSSRSVAPFFQDLKDAAASLVLGLKPEDQVAIYTATVPATRISRLTTDRAGILRALASFQPLGGSAIVDGIDFAANDLVQSENQVRRVILVLSDDIDPISRVPDYQLSRKLLQNEITVFLIKTRSVMPFPMKMRNVAGKRMPFPAATRSSSPVVEATGGKVISLRSRFSALWARRSLSEGFSELLGILRNRYTLGFVPDPTASRFHPIRVALRKDLGPKRFNLRYRQGYWDPPP